MPACSVVNGAKYTVCVLKEALRKYSLVPVITRNAVEDDVIGSLQIPSGTKLFLNLKVCLVLKEQMLLFVIFFSLCLLFWSCLFFLLPRILFAMIIIIIIIFIIVVVLLLLLLWWWLLLFVEQK
jgi:hypothetical protein